ncbi:MAG TPA: hypothetical protein VND65_15035 [Candidatus Binatia bacterium]|nr:hypothetical protein [Candidatus Binatia bacterium]
MMVQREPVRENIERRQKNSFITPLKDKASSYALGAHKTELYETEGFSLAERRSADFLSNSPCKRRPKGNDRAGRFIVID